MHARTRIRTHLLGAAVAALPWLIAGCETASPAPAAADPVAAAAPVSAGAPAPVRYRVCDAHFHYVDFLQRTDGIQALVKAMDEVGVDRSMICGMPLVKKWDAAEPRQPQYYLEDDAPAYWYSATDALVARDIQSLPPAQQARFLPFVCGFNGTDRNAVDHVKRMLEWYPGFWAGIGEVMARHDDLTALTYGEKARANNLALDAVYELAAQEDLPVSIHSDVSSVWLREPLYLHEMEQAVANHRGTRFIWCHAGVSRRIDVPTLTQEIRRLLRSYPNLWVDLSWVVFETYVDPDGSLSQDWVRMLEEFPDRFMIGTDTVGHLGQYRENIQKYYVLLDALSPDTARRVARDNFLSVLPARFRAARQ